MKKIDVEGLKKLLNYLNQKGIEEGKNMADEIAKITVDDGWVDIDGYSFSILEDVEDSYEVEEERMIREVNDALNIVLEDETIFPTVNDREYKEMVSSIAEEMLEDADLTLTTHFMHEVRDRALNHPIIQQKRMEAKRVAKK